MVAVPDISVRLVTLTSMPTKTRRANRGPAVASANRRALLSAARELFAERGYQVPLQAIAQRAGVGQGVLYRHFPNRMLLALAVFEENFVELKAIASDPDEHTFGCLWQRLLAMVIDSAAFVEMAVEARRTLPDYDGPEQLSAVIAEPLRLAQQAGLAPSSMTPADVLVGIRMAYGIVATGTDSQSAARLVHQALGGGPPLPLGVPNLTAPDGTAEA